MKSTNEMKYFKQLIQDDIEFKSIIGETSSSFSISNEAITGYFYNEYMFKESRIEKYYIASFLLLLLVPFLLFFIWLKKNKKNKKNTDILLEEFNQETFGKFYQVFVDKLKNTYVLTRFINYKYVKKNDSNYNTIYRDDYLDKRAILKVIKYILSNIYIHYRLYKISKKYQINFIILMIYFLGNYIKFSSFAKNAKIKLWISAFDYNAHLLKYEILQKYNIKFILLQESLRSDTFMSYKGSDIVFCYSIIQKNEYLNNNNKFKKIIPIGSIVNMKYLNLNVPKVIDYIFIDQRLDYDYYKLEGLSNKSYKKLLENLHSFKLEFPEYKIVYKTRSGKYIKNIEKYDYLIEKLKNIGIVIDDSKDSYSILLQSKVCLGYTSALCFESIGLNVPALFFYYDKYTSKLFDYKKSDEDILVLDDSYESFRKSMLFLLNLDNQKKYFDKYKSLYMNQTENSIEVIMEEVNLILTNWKL